MVDLTYLRAGKRLVDLVLASLALVVASPFGLLIAAAIRLGDGKPVFFRQIRPGLRGAPFELIKFRTMRPDESPCPDPARDGERLGRLGHFLRSSSLDELPGLWNVIRGEMSLVGPRPLLVRYLDRYEPWQARRHEVRPGITGWAQVNGRNALTWDEKFQLDVWYVDHVSFGLDLKILLLTVVKVFRREGISAPGAATMPEFRGRDQ